jgi:hypothetical protein
VGGGGTRFLVVRAGVIRAQRTKYRHECAVVLAPARVGNGGHTKGDPFGRAGRTGPDPRLLDRQAMASVEWIDGHYAVCRPEYEPMLRSVGLQRGWRVLDAGSGSGSFLPLLAVPCWRPAPWHERIGAGTAAGSWAVREYMKCWH